MPFPSVPAKYTPASLSITHSTLEFSIPSEYPIFFCTLPSLIKVRPASPAASIEPSDSAVIVLNLFPLVPLSLSYTCISPSGEDIYIPLPDVHIHRLSCPSLYTHLIRTPASLSVRALEIFLSEQLSDIISPLSVPMYIKPALSAVEFTTSSPMSAP